MLCIHVKPEALREIMSEHFKLIFFLYFYVDFLDFQG